MPEHCWHLGARKPYMVVRFPPPKHQHVAPHNSLTGGQVTQLGAGLTV
jgi:hypothetical protein